MVPAMATIEPYAASTLSVLAERVRWVLGESGLSALPTESFYGLAVASFDTQALARTSHHRLSRNGWTLRCGDGRDWLCRHSFQCLAAVG